MSIKSVIRDMLALLPNNENALDQRHSADVMACVIQLKVYAEEVMRGRIMRTVSRMTLSGQMDMRDFVRQVGVQDCMRGVATDLRAFAEALDLDL